MAFIINGPVFWKWSLKVEVSHNHPQMLPVLEKENDARYTGTD